MTIQKLFCKIMLRSFVLILGLISVTELSANPEFAYSASSLESSVTAPQGGGNVKMTGRVLDETKAGVPGATVIVKGSTRGVITGNDGTFSIDVKPTDVIEISYLGYETQSIPVGTKTNIVTELVRKVSELEAVTVVAYGKQRKESIIGAINTIDAGELEVASGSLSSNLAGKLAGIVVMQRTGEPGSSAEFWIRGQSTFGAKTTPLVLVDGIERDMDFVDADDIATFSILKDATATALYGVRGANGIILITTKRGKTGKTKVTYDGYFGVQNIANKIEMMNGEEFATMSNIAENGGVAPIYGGANEKWKEPSYYRNNSTDWQDLIFRTALMHNHQISLSGGSENNQYAVTGNFFNQDGIVINSDLKRASLRANVDSKISNWINVQTSLTASRTFSNVAFSEGDGAQGGGVINGALAIPSTMYVYNEDGTFSTMNQTPYGVTTGNPYALAELAKDKSTINRVIANVNIKFNLNKLTDGLALEIRGGTDYSNAFRDSYLPSTVFQGESDNGIATKGWNRRSVYLNENLLTYQKKFGQHSINAVAGLTIQYDEETKGKTIVSGFVNDVLEDNSMGSASTTKGTPTSSKWSSQMASWLGRINYNYADRYLLTLTGRADGSSKFGVNNKWGFFPSAALAWRVTEEAFMEEADWLSNLKLRASYGLTGNQGFGSYSSVASLSQYSYNLGGDKATGFAPNKIPNSNLKWETTSNLDLGVDFGFMNNRLNFNVDYYYKKTKDLLWNVSIPLSSGFGSIFSNHGTLRNWGIEASVSYDLITSNKPGAFTWNTTLMYSMNRNKVLSMPDVTPGRPDGYLSGHLRVEGSWLEENYPVGIWKYYVYDGVFENQEMMDATIVNANGETVAKHPKALTTDGLGSPKFKDLNQDGKIDREDWAVIGDPNPDFIFSWTNNFTYKNFDLSIFINGSIGNDIMNLGRGEYAMVSPFASQRRDMLNYWTPTNTQTDIPAPRLAPHAYLPLSSYMIEDGSYVRLKNIVLGYRFPIRKHIESLRLYVSAQNLFTITGYSGFDPEVNSKGQNNRQLGVDYNAYPTSKVFTMGINIAF